MKAEKRLASFTVKSEIHAKEVNKNMGRYPGHWSPLTFAKRVKNASRKRSRNEFLQHFPHACCKKKQNYGAMMAWPYEQTTGVDLIQLASKSLVVW